MYSLKEVKDELHMMWNSHNHSLDGNHVKSKSAIISKTCISGSSVHNFTLGNMHAYQRQAQKRMYIKDKL